MATAVLALTVLTVACGTPPRRQPERAMSMDQINAVLERHAGELMRIPGVTGVYIGARADSSLCLRVLILPGHESSRSQIPERLDGVPVDIEPTDPIRPM